MLSFSNPLVLAGGATFLLVGVPILIHLINMMRHRRVEWAAMEFLLASQKKNRTYVMLKQLLLLAMRVAAILAIIFIIARPLFKDPRFAHLLGGATTHHILILDDSYSMSDRASDTSAFERAKTAILRIAQRAVADGTPNEMTIIRTSKGTPERTERLTREYEVKLDELLKTFQPSETNAGPGEVLGKLETLLGEPKGENRLVYILSDFRENEWNDPVELTKTLTDLNEADAQLFLVSCTDKVNENLGVVALKPLSLSRSAGVPTQMEVSVKNFGTRVAKNVSVQVQEDRLQRSGVEFDQIAPGKTETRRFSVQFLNPGFHRVTARIDADSVEADNARHVVMDFPPDVPVLVIDGNPVEKDAWFLSVVLNPGGKPGTGINAKLERPQYLTSHPLDPYRVIYLVNIERLDQAAVAALEAYLKNGGGVAMFLGKNTNPDFVTTELYRDGKGFFPLPIGPSTELLVQALEKGTDLKVTPHPVLRVFAGERNSYLNDVSILRYVTAPKKWKPPVDSTVEVIASLRNDAPLIVERKFGEGKVQGRVMAFLTTAGPTWNNWARNPSFIVTLHELQNYLSGADPETRTIGTPIELTLDAAQYERNVELLRPGVRGDIPLKSVAEQVSEGNKQEVKVKFPVTDVATSGVYEVKLTRADKSDESRVFAYNVVPDEGNLHLVNGEQLVGKLKGVTYLYQQAADFQGGASNKAGSNLSEWILYGLIILLILEQILAYFLGYHPPKAVAGGAR